MPEANKELKPCPFCGEVPKVQHHIGFGSSTYIQCPNTDCLIFPRVTIEAGSKAHSDGKTFEPIYTDSDKRAIEAWNRRPSSGDARVLDELLKDIRNHENNSSSPSSIYWSLFGDMVEAKLSELRTTAKEEKK